MDATPTSSPRRSLRAARVNYAAMSSGGTLQDERAGSEAEETRTPSTIQRGKRRQPIDDDGPSTVPKRGRPRGSVSRVVRRGGRADESESEDRGLVAALKSSSRVVRIVDEWLQEYERNQSSGLQLIYQLFITASGCRAQVNDRIMRMDLPSMIATLSDDFEDAAEYPLIAAASIKKNFRRNFETLLKTLIGACKSSAVFDETLVDRTSEFLATLAESNVRAFRHTATFAAMKMSTALVDLCVELDTTRNRNDQQIDAEKVKVRSNDGAGNTKLDLLMHKKEELNSKLTEVKQMLGYFFKSVFVNRYRDVVPDIRCICIEELGEWMKNSPDNYLNDNFLKYIGWTLYDKTPEVRQKCVFALRPLFDRDDLRPLELFVSKFKDRLVGMVSDENDDVAVHAIVVNTAIYRAFPSLLTLDDCVPIYEAVYATNRQVAVAAGRFLCTKLFQQLEPAEKELQLLVQFFKESEVHDHMHYLVDALIDLHPMIKDWVTIADLLDGEHNHRHYASLLEAAVRGAATGEPPIARVPRPKLTHAQQVACVSDRSQLTEALSSRVPDLMVKYAVELETSLSLLEVVKLFDFDFYVSARKERELHALLTALEKTMEVASDEERLRAVSEILALLNSKAASSTEAFRHTLTDQISTALQNAIAGFLNWSGDTNPDDRLVLALCKWCALLQNISGLDAKKYDYWDRIMDVLQQYERAQHRPSKRLIEKGIELLHLQLAFELVRIVNDSDGNPKQSIRKRLASRVDAFFDIALSVTKYLGSSEAITMAMCDTTLLFSSRLTETNPALDELTAALPSEEKLTDHLIPFINGFVFSDDSSVGNDGTETVENIHKKRTSLALFSKLILHGVLKYNTAAVVLRNFAKDHANFGDIMKTLLIKCRDTNAEACGTAIFVTLRMEFETLTSPHATSTANMSLVDLLDLSKKLAAQIGNDMRKIRECVTNVHRLGIKFAVSGMGPNVVGDDTNERDVALPAFFEFLEPFVHKLLPQDRKKVHDYIAVAAKKYGGGRMPTGDIYQHYSSMLN